MPIRGLVGVLLVAAVLLGVGLGRQAVARAQELRVVLTARRMAGGGSWLIPEYQGQTRLKKPPMMYWIVAAAYRMTGAARSAVASRLPTVMFALATVALIYAGGRRLIGRRRALAGAFVAATSFILLRHGRLAETDIPLAFFTSLAIFLSHAALGSPRPILPWAAAGAAAGLGFMVKGPAALALPVAAAGFAAVVSRRFRRGAGWAVAALPAFLALALPWYLYLWLSPALQGVAGRAVSSELHALGDKTGHPGSLFFYVFTSIQALLPWGLLLPVALWDLVRRHGRRRSGVRFLLAWFAGTFLILTLTPSKQIHYATLLLAPSALITGSLLEAGWRQAGATWRRRLAGGYLRFLGTALVATGVALPLTPLWMEGARWTPCVASGILLVVLGLGVSGPAGVRWPARLAALAGAVLVAESVYLFHLYDLSDAKSAYARFGDAAAADVRAAPAVFVTGAEPGALEFHLGRPVREVDSVAEAVAAWRPGDALVVSENHRCRRPVPDTLPPPSRILERKDVRLALYRRP